MPTSAPAAAVVFASWQLIAAVLGVCIAMLKGISWVLGQKRDEAHAAVLAIKQATVSMFMQVVIAEAQRLFDIIDDHLPRALSQATKSVPTKSRFDYLCESLRKLTDNDLNEDENDVRGRFRQIIEVVFAGVVADEIRKLMAAASPGARTAATDLQNPTGLRFSLEEPTNQKFSFVSWKFAEATKRERRFYLHHSIARFCLIVACCLGILYSITGGVGALGYLGVWCPWVCIPLLIGFAIFGIWGLVAMLMITIHDNWIRRTSEKFQDDAEVVKEFESWKERVT